MACFLAVVAVFLVTVWRTPELWIASPAPAASTFAWHYNFRV
jgi:hypothetical protein